MIFITLHFGKLFLKIIHAELEIIITLLRYRFKKIGYNFFFSTKTNLQSSTYIQIWITSLYRW
jgi:hypothetical protein